MQEMEAKQKFAAFLAKDGEKSSNVVSLDQNHLPFEAHSQSENVLKSSIKLCLQDYNQVMEVHEILLEDLIKPQIFLAKYFLPFQNTFDYDPTAKRVVLVKGSFVRKTIWILLEMIVLYRLGSKLISGLDKGSAITTGSYVTFVMFNLAWLHFYWLKTKNCCDIFNQVLDLAGDISLEDRSPTRIKLVRYGMHATWIFTTLYVILTLALYTIQLYSMEMSDVNSSNNSELLVSSRNYKNSFDTFDVTEIPTGMDYNIIPQVVSIVGSFLTIFYWMMAYWQGGVWALFFRQLIMTFYWRIRTKRELGQFIKFPQEIRTFNRIVSVLDEYNNIAGIGNLFAAIVLVTFISTSVKDAFSDFLNCFQIGAGLHLTLSFVPLVVVAFCLADVQRVAGLFAGILKEEYGRFNPECGDPAESLCGIAIVHHDLSMSNIGMKGLGFYTVSYQFITTIAGAIITYSMLVFQLAPRPLEQ